MNKPVKRVAVIHDISGVGKAALTNIIPVLSFMEIEVCPIPTMLLSTHTGGFGKPVIEKFPGYIEKCKDHYFECKIKFEGLFIGYLGSDEAIRESIEFIKYNSNSLKVIDPVFGDNAICYSNFDLNYVQKIKELISYADLITPNFTEACFLAETKYIENVTYEDVKNICEKLALLGAKEIVITSVPNKNPFKISIAIYVDGDLSIIEKDKESSNYPGTGDIFTSIIIGEILRGANLINSVEKAHNFVSECIKDSLNYNYPTREGVLLEKNLIKLIKSWQ